MSCAELTHPFLFFLIIKRECVVYGRVNTPTLRLFNNKERGVVMVLRCVAFLVEVETPTSFFYKTGVVVEIDTRTN